MLCKVDYKYIYYKNGIEINEEEIKKHPFKQEVLQRTFYKDNSIGDW